MTLAERQRLILAVVVALATAAVMLGIHAVLETREATGASVAAPGARAAPTGPAPARVEELRRTLRWELAGISLIGLALAGVLAAGLRLARRDAEDRDRAAVEIREAEARLRSYFESPLVGIAVLEPDGTWLEMNDRLCAMSGYAREELRTLHWTDLSHPDELPADLVQYQRMMAGEIDRYQLDKRYRRKDGSWLHTSTSASCVRGPDGRPLRVVAFLQDIGARKAAEEAREASEALLRSITDSSPDPMFAKDLEGRWTFANAAALRVAGRTAAEMLGRTDEEITGQAPAAEALGVNDRMVATSGVVLHFEETLPSTDGPRRFLTAKAPLRDPAGRVVGVVGVARDVTDRERTVEALRRSEARFRALAEGAPLGIVETDLRGRASFVNRAFAAIAGVPAGELLGEALWTAVHPEDRPVVWRAAEQAARGGGSVDVEFRMVRPDGRMRLVRGRGLALEGGSGAPRGYLGIADDITDRRAMREQLAVASRLAAMGTLVAGVSHEVNNPLAGVLAGQDLALDLLQGLRARALRGAAPPVADMAAALSEALEALGDARTGALRIRDIVKDLVTFGRPDARRARIGLMDAVEEALRWLPHSLPGRTTLRVENRGAPDVLGSVGQLAQVVVNLVTNATRAIPEGRDGHVTIRLGPGAPGMARLEVVDDGEGITREVMERMFDPFFTTREVGQGMGLGLPVCHAIVTAHGGTLTATSEPGRGATFVVELPAAPADG
jgi:PAS domain S-box-containing protein